MAGDLRDLLEKAEGPDRKLDERIAAAVGAHGPREDAPPYTASLDAALTLIPNGWYCDLHNGSPMPPPSYVWLWRRGFGGAQNKRATDSRVYGSAATPALAICIAALKARMKP